VLLDEKRMAGVQEILSNRKIPAKEKIQFLKTPAAFLDASLVDLGNDLSIRVHGATVFQKAYFGETDAQSLSWFGDSENEPDVIPLGAADSLLSDRKDLQELKTAVETTLLQGQTSLLFKNKTIILPAQKAEVENIFNGFDKAVGDQDEPEPPQPPQKKQTSHDLSEPNPNITVKIDLNEDEVPDGFNTLPTASTGFYSGPICGDGCTFTPFQYQEKGIRWLLELAQQALHFPEKNRFAGALLADDMGLGKTFMTLASLQVYMSIMQNEDKQKPILVVAPVVLLENWQKEVENVFEKSPFKDIVILQTDCDLPRFRQDGAGRETKTCLDKDEAPESAIRYSLKVGADFGNFRLDMPGRLVLTNYDTLRDYQFSLCMVDWGMVIFDEAQDIKNPNTMKSRAAKGLKANFRLAVTGTPVENSLVDFWSIFDTISPGVLGAYKKFLNEYVSPIKRASSDERNDVRIQVGTNLRKAVGDLMLRRTKEECLDCLPQKIIHDGGDPSGNSKKYTAMMHGQQKKRYDAVVASVAAARNSGDSRKILQSVLPGLRRLRDVSLHPGLLDGGVPPVSSDPETMKSILCKSEKLRLLLNIINEIRERQEKVIVFVINKKLQKFLSIGLSTLYKIPVDVINGDTKSVASRTGRGTESRMQIIKRFEAQPDFGIIVMSPLAAGVGLTVVGANNVIHLERHWNPAKEAQATDRVYRIGAKKDVHVYIPILTHPELKSFDKNLQELLINKVDLKDAVITPTEVAPDDFDTKEIFGGKIPSDAIITSEWLEDMGWDFLEALTAELAAEEFCGESFLTPVSGDFGADVVTISPKETNILIQCKCTSNTMDNRQAVLEPYYARPEYELRMKKNFKKLILCTNSYKISRKVREKGKKYEVEIWSGNELEDLLKKHRVSYDMVSNRLNSERIRF
jgi:SNF2 family DNA or RNA helicase